MKEMRKIDNFVKKYDSDKLNMLLFDKIKAMIRCKSNYSSQNYKNMKKIILENIEIRSIIRDSLQNKKLMNSLFNNAYI